MKYKLKQEIEGVELQTLEVGNFFAVNKKVYILLGNYAHYDQGYESEIADHSNLESDNVPLGMQMGEDDLLAYCLDDQAPFIFEDNKEVVPLKQVSNIEFVIGGLKMTNDPDGEVCPSCYNMGDYKDDNCTCHIFEDEDEDEDPVDLSNIKRKKALPTKKKKTLPRSRGKR